MACTRADERATWTMVMKREPIATIPESRKFAIPVVTGFITVELQKVLPDTCQEIPERPYAWLMLPMPE